MKNSTFRFGGFSAILVGMLSLLYALFYLVISRRTEMAGMIGSWLILSLSGLFTSAAYVAIYQRVRKDGEGLALWALILGAAASFATFQHGAYEGLILRAQPLANRGATLPSQVDPSGLATFLVIGIVSFLFSILILQGTTLSKGLGILGIVNAVLLVVLYFATERGMQGLILISGGLTSVILGPVWWIWLGISLLNRKQISAETESVLHPA